MIIPIEGQAFTSFQDWVNRAYRALTNHPQYHNTEHEGPAKGWRGAHFTAMCFDQRGRRCRDGEDFRRAEEGHAFPIWWIWPDQLPHLIIRLVAAEQANDRWRQNSIDTWAAMQAMRNDINEHVPMPSIEADLIEGPENSVFCATIAAAVVAALTHRRASQATPATSDHVISKKWAERMLPLDEGVTPSAGAPAPSDGTCAECGCAPTNAAGLCATCVDERTPAPSDGLQEENERLRAALAAAAVWSVEGSVTLKEIGDVMRPFYRPDALPAPPQEEPKA